MGQELKNGAALFIVRLNSTIYTKVEWSGIAIYAQRKRAQPRADKSWTYRIKQWSALCCGGPTSLLVAQRVSSTIIPFGQFQTTTQGLNEPEHSESKQTYLQREKLTDGTVASRMTRLEVLGTEERITEAVRSSLSLHGNGRHRSCYTTRSFGHQKIENDPSVQVHSTTRIQASKTPHSLIHSPQFRLGRFSHVAWTESQTNTRTVTLQDLNDITISGCQWRYYSPIISRTEGPTQPNC